MRNVLKVPDSEVGVVVELDPNMTGSQVADEVADLRELPRARIRLLRNGAVLPPTKSLKDCDVRPGDEIHVLLSDAPPVQTSSVPNKDLGPHQRRMFRQGDILLREVFRLPPNTRQAADQGNARILAYGEKTGHMHIMQSGTVYETSGPAGAKKFVQVAAPTQLVHDEHAAIDVPPGIWEIIQQRTYVPTVRPQRASQSRQDQSLDSQGNWRPAWD